LLLSLRKTSSTSPATVSIQPWSSCLQVRASIAALTIRQVWPSPTAWKRTSAALTQSASNATDGVGELQVADGALSQVTTLLDRAVTLATESATGTVSNSQRGALDTEYQSIKAEIDSIGSTTNFNGGQVFTGEYSQCLLE
jgi:hypothetical protein